MFNLLANENTKIYRRMRTWIMVGLMVVATILVAWAIQAHQHPDANWQAALTTENQQAEQSLAKNSHMPASVVEQMKQQIQVNNYYLSHNINPALQTGWKFVITAMNLKTLLMAFILVVAGDIVASEFSAGTIKMLLTQTATRTEIILSKFLTAVSFGVFMTIVMFVSSLVVGWLFFGTAGADESHIYMGADGKIHTMSIVSNLLMQYGFLLIQMVLIVSIAFMISSIFRSSALAITISLLAYIVGSTIVGALSNFSWVKYILFANTDLMQYVAGGPMIHGMTLGFSITMLIIYFVVMNVLSWLVFVKRDVAYT